MNTIKLSYKLFYWKNTNPNAVYQIGVEMIIVRFVARYGFEKVLKMSHNKPQLYYRITVIKSNNYFITAKQINDN